jgi:hypothetical protein
MLNPFRPPSPPRRITEVWGIPSPIDTVFTRCNCEGKTFFFKVTQTLGKTAVAPCHNIILIFSWKRIHCSLEK